jgi:hypothetical protein
VPDVTDGGADAGSADAGAPDAGAPDSGMQSPYSCPDGVPFELIAGKVVVTATVNGTDYKFMYDTGAPGSVISTALSASLQQPITVVLAGETINQVEFYPQTNPLESLGVVGIIGTNIVHPYAVTIDYQRQRFWLAKDRNEPALFQCTHVARDPSVQPLLVHDYLYVPGQLEGVDGWLLVDTGATYGGVPQPIFDARVAAAPRPFLTGFYTPAAIGTFWADLGSVGSIETGGRKVDHLLVRTVPDGLLSSTSFLDGGTFLGLLPSGFLKHFMVTVDFPNRQLRLDAYVGDDGGEPSSVFPVGIGLDDAASAPFTVATVLPGSAAADAGVQVGDELIQVAGQDPGALQLPELPWKLCGTAPGQSIAVTVRHNGADTLLNLQTSDLLTNP